MLCTIYKWMISWHLDSGKELSGTVSRHIRRCRNCREFARISSSLGQKFNRDAFGFFQRNNDFHNKLDIEITSTLDERPKNRLTPKQRLHFRLIPALTAALLAVLVTSVILFQVAPLTTSRPDKNPVTAFPGAIFTKNPLHIVKKVESPIEAEMNKVRQSIDSAVKFLVSRLDVKIGQE
jgi:hypothetical protein